MFCVLGVILIKTRTFSGYFLVHSKITSHQNTPSFCTCSSPLLNVNFKDPFRWVIDYSEASAALVQYAALTEGRNRRAALWLLCTGVNLGRQRKWQVDSLRNHKKVENLFLKVIRMYSKHDRKSFQSLLPQLSLPFSESSLKLLLFEAQTLELQGMRTNPLTNGMSPQE